MNTLFVFILTAMALCIVLLIIMKTTKKRKTKLFIGFIIEMIGNFVATIMLFVEPSYFNLAFAIVVQIFIIIYVRNRVFKQL